MPNNLSAEYYDFIMYYFFHYSYTCPHAQKHVATVMSSQGGSLPTHIRELHKTLFGRSRIHPPFVDETISHHLSNI